MPESLEDPAPPGPPDIMRFREPEPAAPAADYGPGAFDAHVVTQFVIYLIGNPRPQFDMRLSGAHG